MRIVKLTICFGLLLVGIAAGTAYSQTKESRDVFWKKFRTAVVKKDKTTVANLSQFPIFMPYGMRDVRSRPQLIKRYRDVFNHEGDASVCFAAAKPVTEAKRPKEFTVGCKNAAGDEVVIYHFLLTKNGWRFNGLDNINE